VTQSNLRAAWYRQR